LTFKIYLQTWNSIIIIYMLWWCRLHTPSSLSRQSWSAVRRCDGGGGATAKIVNEYYTVSFCPTMSILLYSGPSSVSKPLLCTLMVWRTDGLTPRWSDAPICRWSVFFFNLFYRWQILSDYIFRPALSNIKKAKLFFSFILYFFTGLTHSTVAVHYLKPVWRFALYCHKLFYSKIFKSRW
jgi:hypothetical protein